VVPYHESAALERNENYATQQSSKLAVIIDFDLHMRVDDQPIQDNFVYDLVSNRLLDILLNNNLLICSLHTTTIDHALLLHCSMNSEEILE